MAADHTIRGARAASVTDGMRSRSAGQTKRLLTALIFVGALVMFAIPLAALRWLAAVGSGALIVYLLVLAGVAALMCAWGALLVYLDRIRANAFGDQSTTVLTTCITIAFLLAVAVIVTWFVFSSGTGPDVRGPFPD